MDLARLAGLQPAGVICEILSEDGTMARRPQLELLATELGLTFITVAQVVAYRLRTERLVHRVAEARLPTRTGEWRIVGYHNDVDKAEHVALVFGDLASSAAPLVRMHSKCLTGDVFHSARCDCGWQLDAAMAAIQAEGAGAVIYLDQEGRGIGLLNKLKAYELQDQGHDTVEANRRPRLRARPAQLRHRRPDPARSRADEDRVLTNNPMKLVGIEGYGLTLAGRVPIVPPRTDENAGYLDVKRDKLGHLFVDG